MILNFFHINLTNNFDELVETAGEGLAYSGTGICGQVAERGKQLIRKVCRPDKEQHGRQVVGTGQPHL